ncbi:hypothetical protein GCM10022254_73240 [Actinomadura meridiana]|uniref:Uncharacterized protein n=1 Tax=Actinomadura meridiana TaxID=559626 RepID=A0ABP8CQ45_9ACTN
MRASASGTWLCSRIRSASFRAVIFPSVSTGPSVAASADGGANRAARVAAYVVPTSGGLQTRGEGRAEPVLVAAPQRPAEIAEVDASGMPDQPVGQVKREQQQVELVADGALPGDGGDGGVVEPGQAVPHRPPVEQSPQVGAVAVGQQQAEHAGRFGGDQPARDGLQRARQRPGADVPFEQRDHPSGRVAHGRGDAGRVHEPPGRVDALRQFGEPPLGVVEDDVRVRPAQRCPVRDGVREPVDPARRDVSVAGGQQRGGLGVAPPFGGRVDERVGQVGAPVPADGVVQRGAGGGGRVGETVQERRRVDAEPDAQPDRLAGQPGVGILNRRAEVRE